MDDKISEVSEVTKIRWTGVIPPSAENGSMYERQKENGKWELISVADVRKALSHGEIVHFNPKEYR